MEHKQQTNKQKNGMQIFVLDIVDVSKFTFWEYLYCVSSFKSNTQTFTKQRCRCDLALLYDCFTFLSLPFSLCIGTTLNNATCWSEVFYGISLWHCSKFPYVYSPVQLYFSPSLSCSLFMCANVFHWWNYRLHFIQKTLSLFVDTFFHAFFNIWCRVEVDKMSFVLVSICSFSHRFKESGKMERPTKMVSRKNIWENTQASVPQ